MTDNLIENGKTLRMIRENMRLSLGQMAERCTGAEEGSYELFLKKIEGGEPVTWQFVNVIIQVGYRLTDEEFEILEKTWTEAVTKQVAKWKADATRCWCIKCDNTACYKHIYNVPADVLYPRVADNRVNCPKRIPRDTEIKIDKLCIPIG